MMRLMPRQRCSSKTLKMKTMMQTTSWCLLLEQTLLDEVRVHTTMAARLWCSCEAASAEKQSFLQQKLDHSSQEELEVAGAARSAAIGATRLATTTTTKWCQRMLEVDVRPTMMTTTTQRGHRRTPCSAETSAATRLELAKRGG